MKQNLVLKTAMRLAFEQVLVPETPTPIYKRVFRVLRSKAGLVFRKTMWSKTRSG